MLIKYSIDDIENPPIKHGGGTAAGSEGGVQIPAPTFEKWRVQGIQS